MLPWLETAKQTSLRRQAVSVPRAPSTQVLCCQVEADKREAHEAARAEPAEASVPEADESADLEVDAELPVCLLDDPAKPAAREAAVSEPVTADRAADVGGAAELLVWLQGDTATPANQAADRPNPVSADVEVAAEDAEQEARSSAEERNSDVPRASQGKTGGARTARSRVPRKRFSPGRHLAGYMGLLSQGDTCNACSASSECL